MSKLSFAALSLIGAIPGGYLSFLLIMAMVHHFRDMVGMMKVVVCLILVLSAVVAVIPIGILLFVKEEKKGKAKADESDAENVVEEKVTEVTATEDEEGRQSVMVEETTTRVEMSDSFADEFAEVEEEPEPKGKKKKKRKK